MIIVIQSVPAMLRNIEGELPPELKDKVIFTGEVGDALVKVAEWKDNRERTIVISSWRFYATETSPDSRFVTGGTLALGLKEIDPNLWFFLYSLEPRSSKEIDGVIPKDLEEVLGEGRMHGLLFELLLTDFNQVTTIDELRRRLLWLE